MTVATDISTKEYGVNGRSFRRRRRGPTGVLRSLALLGAAVLQVVVLWQLLYLSGWKSAVVLPSPGTVAASLWQQLNDTLLWDAIATTMTRALIGFGLAVLIGSLTGVLISRNGLLRSAFGPVITGLQTMPAIAWFPFAIIFFGLHTSAILFVIVIGAAPSVAIGVIAGTDHIPPLLLRAAHNMGLRRFALYRHVMLPASLPMFVSGLRQGWAFAWRSLMAGELVVLVTNTVSIGALLENAQNLTDMPAAIAIMVVILIIGIIADTAFGLADHQIRARWGLLDPDAP